MNGKRCCPYDGPPSKYQQIEHAGDLGPGGGPEADEGNGWGPQAGGLWQVPQKWSRPAIQLSDPNLNNLVFQQVDVGSDMRPPRAGFCTEQSNVGDVLIILLYGVTPQGESGT